MSAVEAGGKIFEISGLLWGYGSYPNASGLVDHLVYFTPAYTAGALSLCCERVIQVLSLLLLDGERVNHFVRLDLSGVGLSDMLMLAVQAESESHSSVRLTVPRATEPKPSGIWSRMRLRRHSQPRPDWPV